MPLPFHSQIQSLVPTGTAPLSIVSTTVNANLNADLLDGQHGAFYQDASNLNAGTLPAARLSPFVVPLRYSIPETGSTAQYVYLGRWVTVQGGQKLRMRVTAGEGYNANTSQNQMTELYFKTSNGGSSQTGSSGVYYADGVAFRIGPNPNAPSLFRVVAVDSVTYDIYGYFSTFTGGGSFYELTISTGTWTHSGTLATPSGNYIDITPSAILHAGNYNSYALPLTGGTLTGALAGTSASFSGALTSGGNSVLTTGNYSSYAVDNTKRVKQFFWDGLSASTTQARRYEIARIAIDIVNWNQVGTFEIELCEQYYSKGIKKRYAVWYGYSGTRPGLKLVEMTGAGDNNFQVVLGTEQPVSGNQYYLPIYVDVRYYSIVDVRVTTSRQITASSTPPVGYTYINSSPTPTNITDFTADSTVDLSPGASAWLVGGNVLLHGGNFNSYALPLSGGTLTGNLNLSAATLLNIGQQARIQFSYSNLQTVDSGSDRAGWMWNSYYDWSGTPSYKFWSTNAQGASMLHMSPTQLTFYTKAGPSTANAAFTWDASNVVLHAGNYNSYVLAASGTAASLSIGGSAAQLNGQAASFYQNAGNLNAGTLPSARLAGTYTIDILGAASSGSRLGQWDGTTYNTGSNSIGSSGGRGTSLAPNTYVKQVSFEFKNTTFTSMTGNYGGLITIAPWDGTTASTGDPNYQILINPAAANSTSAPTIRVRAGIDTTWGSWATLIHDGNFTTAIPNSGVTAGTYNNVTVNAKGIVTGGSNVGYLTGNQSISLGGDLSGSGTTSITATIANNAVTNAKLNTMGAGTIKGNNGGVANNPSDLTAAQVAAMLSGQAMNIAGSSSSCTGSAAQLNGQAASYYENRDTTAVGISAGVLTLTRAAGNLTTTIGGRVVAWCDFNGNFATTQTPNAHFNVSSITKNATGDYTVNFSSALANANYVVAGSAQLDAPSPGQSNYNVMVAVPRRSGAKATGSCRIVCEYPLGVTLYDSVSVGVAFIAA